MTQFPKYGMFTQIVDDKNFIIGETQYSAGDRIVLTPEEEATLAHIRDMDKLVHDARQELIDRVHGSELTYLPGIVSDLHELSILATEMRVAIPMFILNLSKRMGGRLPIELDDKMENLTVRDRRQGESLNYTLPSALEMLTINTLKYPRELAFALVGGRKPKTKIDTNLDKQYGIQPVTIENSMTMQEALDAVPAFLAKFANPEEMLVIILGSLATYTCCPYDIRDRRTRKDNWSNIVSLCNNLETKGLVVLFWTPPKKPGEGWAIIAAVVQKNDKGTPVIATHSFNISAKGEFVNLEKDIKFDLKGFDLPMLFSCVTKG